MKKITLAIASLFIIGLFSSCIVIGADEDPYAIIHIENYDEKSKSDKKVEKSDSDDEDEEETNSKSKKNNSSESDKKKDSSKDEEKSDDTSDKTTQKPEDKPAETTTPAQTTPAETTPSETTTPTPTEQEPAKEVLYKVTAINRTSVPVIDWCVKKGNKMIFSSAENAHAIEPGAEDAIIELPEGEYKIFFSFEGYGFGTDWTLYDAGSFTLDQNMTYIITERVLEVYEQAFEECRNAVK